MAVAATIIVSFTYVVAQIYAVGLIASRFTGVDFSVGIFLGLASILVCSFLGGMRAITWTQVAQALAQPLRLGLQAGDAAEEAQLQASIGITLYPQGVDDLPLNAMGRAGTALHRAKHGGGARAAFFEQGMGEVAAQRFHLERDL
eukprot:gene44174-54911_t